MSTPPINFDNGATYEAFMGVWSQRVGDAFLDWLAPQPALRWIDVGCGNGAFTETLLRRCAPIAIEGIDPSSEQIDFALGRLPASAPVSFRIGDSMDLPFADGTFDAAVMALVLFFVPDPAKGVAEMARVVAPGASVSAYVWDIFGGGFPYAAMSDEMAKLGTPPLWPISAEASRMESMRDLWTNAGLVDIATRVIPVERTFTDFDEFWRIAQTGPRVAPRLASMGPADVAVLVDRLRALLPTDGSGRITCGASANAIKGRVAG